MLRCFWLKITADLEISGGYFFIHLLSLQQSITIVMMVTIDAIIDTTALMISKIITTFIIHE